MTRVEDLSPEQRKVVESWGQGMAVLAGAGSGKTTTLVIKCEELLKRNPKAKFAAVSFTERSASDLRLKLAQRLSGGGELTGHWVMTIHGLCGAILRDFPREAGFDGGESMLSEPEAQLLWERALEALWQDELPEQVDQGLEVLLGRESRDSLMDLLRRVRELSCFGALDSLGASEDKPSRALREVSAYVLDRYDRLKRRRGALDFGDLERGADRALEHARVREDFHRRFDMVLVDEFQDTNPLQARIILRFCRPDLSNLCVVGDPKQSIYRFRDADVTVFEDFCSRLPLGLSLTWNFRSRPGIIDYANELCAKAFEASAMKYEALVPKREPEPELAPVVRVDVEEPASLARWILGEVARGVRLRDMALLLRRIRGNEHWLKALTSAGIPIAVGSGGLFWEDPRVRELVSLLKWWDNPGNTLSGAVFLRAPWVGVPDERLDEWIRGASTGPTLLSSFLASGHSLAAVLARCGACSRPGEILQALLTDETEAELGAPWLGLWHRVEELSSRGLDFHGVVTELTQALEHGRRERDVPPPRNQGQLSVLTLHSSKGLEFPHVLLLDLGKKPKTPNAPLLFWDRERGAYLGTRDSDGEREAKHPVESRWREEEKAKNLAESKRLFYVALTRARERLILACPKVEDTELDPEKAYASDDWRAWVECCGAEIPTGEAGEGAAKAEAELSKNSVSVSSVTVETVWKRPRHSVTEWNCLLRCPRAYEWKFIRPVAVAEGVPDIGLFTGDPVESEVEAELTQKELGSRVHACLENGDYEGLRRLQTEVGEDRFLAEPVISWAMSSDWMAPPSEQGGERCDGARDVWPELEFEVPIGGEALVGSIDRLVKEYRDGVAHYWLIDFKVSEKPKSANALLESYSGQMELYAHALLALEPEAVEAAAEGRLQALLVNILPQSIQAVPVPLGRLDVPALAAEAARIVNGGAGNPKPGSTCRYCEFRSKCPEGGAQAGL